MASVIPFKIGDIVEVEDWSQKLLIIDIEYRKYASIVVKDSDGETFWFSPGDLVKVSDMDSLFYVFHKH